MNLTAEQMQIASMIDTKFQALSGAGCHDATILGEMLDYMPGLKRLMGALQQGGMDEMCRRFPWFYRYAKLLEGVAAGIQSG